MFFVQVIEIVEEKGYLLRICFVGISYLRFFFIYSRPVTQVTDGILSISDIGLDK